MSTVTEYSVSTTQPQVTMSQKWSCRIVQANLQWNPPLTPMPTMTGLVYVPLIPKAQIVVGLLVPPTGPADDGSSAPAWKPSGYPAFSAAVGIPLNVLTAPSPVDYNGQIYSNTYHTGGGLQTHQFNNEGVQAWIASVSLLVLGQATVG